MAAASCSRYPQLPRHAVPVSGGVIVVLGGGTARQDSPCQPIKQPFPTSCLGRGEHAVSCLPLLPPRSRVSSSPGSCWRFDRIGLSALVCAPAPTAPPDHSCWSQEWAIETTEAHRICKPLFGSQRIRSQPSGPLVRSHLQPARAHQLHCTQSYVGNMSRGSRHPPPSPGGGGSSESSRLDRGTRDEGRGARNDMAALCKR